MRRRPQQDAAQRAQSPRSHHHHRRLVEIDQIQQHVPRVLGVDRLARNLDLQPRPLQQMRRLLGKHSCHGLSDALMFQPRGHFFVLGIQCVEFRVGGWEDRERDDLPQ